ncbi:MAG: orotidine-5'-phosphate decarboxylase [bacterium]
MNRDPGESLCFALDVPDREAARDLVTRLAGTVGLFKVGLELFVSEGPSLLREMAGWGAAKIFLDLKLHDIPRTVLGACRSAGRAPVELLSVHAEALWQSGRSRDRSISEAGPRLLGITVLTSVADQDLEPLGYARGLSVSELVVLRASIAREAGCAGVVCSGREVGLIRKRLGADLLVLAPGIRPEWALVSGDDQSRVRTAYGAIREGADYVVVGRPIRDAPDPREAAARIVEEIERGYRDRG